MKSRAEVTKEKLRGGFYTPAWLVELCLERISGLLNRTSANGLRLLEPSAGNGAFIRGLGQSPMFRGLRSVVAVELVPSEAREIPGTVGSCPVDRHVGSFLSEGAWETSSFDVACGNPPFVRFQFISNDDLKSIEAVAAKLGLSFKGVSNLWIPIFLKTLSLLKLDGVFSFVVPVELFTGVSGLVARRWLIANCSDLRVDLFAPGSFPDVLQEIVVVSGRRVPRSDEAIRKVQFSEASSTLDTISWEHDVRGDETWTRYLLSDAQLRAVDEAWTLPSTRRLSDVARFEVATVTGANKFFTVSQSIVREFALEPWAIDILPKTKYASGLLYRQEDHDSLAEGSEVPVFLLDFAASKPNPLDFEGPRAYLASGERQKLPARYKCRTRKPWYRVPIVAPGKLLLSKRCHRFPRVYMNEAGVHSTDTIYRGRLLSPETRIEDFVAGFHNSLTLLSAELAGRSFGGGVLELVPSEVSSLAVVDSGQMAQHLARLDAIARDQGSDSEELVFETDKLLVKAGVLEEDLLEVVSQARSDLCARRLERNLSA